MHNKPLQKQLLIQEVKRKNEPRQPKIKRNTTIKITISDYYYKKTEIDTMINDSSFTTLQAVYPVGSIYMSVNTVNPSILFGFGVWEKIEDKFLLASGTTFEDGSTGGSADSVVVSHNHTQNSHAHSALSNRRFVVVGDGANWGYSGKIKIGTGENTTAYYYVHSTENTGGIIEHTETAGASPTINSTGEDGTGKNMPPYLAVNMWKRVE